MLRPSFPRRKKSAPSRFSIPLSSNKKTDAAGARFFPVITSYLLCLHFLSDPKYFSGIGFPGRSASQ